MLASLRIQNVVLIEQLDLEFHAGLCALTGETGAGKSILLDSLGLALGARADAGLVRNGADKAQVSAVFDVGINHVVLATLEDAQVNIEAGESIILRRSLIADGGSKAYINDQPVSAGLLKKVGQSLLEIHGQFDTQGLLNAASHRGLLDEYAGVKDGVSKHWQNWQKQKDQLQNLKENVQNARAEEEYLREALEDLDNLNPQPDEETELASLRDRLMNREQVLEALNIAHQALNSDNDPVRAAWGAIDRVADKIGEQINGVTGALDRATSEIQEAISEIQRLSSDLEHSEHDLQSIDDRLFALRAQARKHNCEVDQLSDIRESLAERLNAMEHEDELLAQAMKNVEAAKNEYTQAAQSIHELRQKTAKRLDDLVAKELPPLKLDRAQFVTKVELLEEAEWNQHGMDRVRFLVATNPGAEAGPLNKIASGGEMSRFMLALKVVMSEVGVANSLIFDEVDAGIGGGTADAVGERLARLAQDKQIMVVTHSPQVAARANHHWIVQKTGDEIVRTSVVPLPQEQDRREEIARMLAGATITEEARAAADKLLEISKAA